MKKFLVGMKSENSEEYLTLVDLLKKVDTDVSLHYCRNNNSIQVRRLYDRKFLGCLKFDWKDDEIGRYPG